MDWFATTASFLEYWARHLAKDDGPAVVLLRPKTTMNGTVATKTFWQPRIALKTLFAVVTAISLLLAPVHWFGVLYLISAAFSLSLIACCALMYRHSRVGSVLVAFGGAFLGFVFVLLLVVYFLHAALNAIACLLLALKNPSPRVFAAVLITLMAAVYGYAFLQGAVAVREIRVLQAQYPFESLEHRLAFEKSGSSTLHPVDSIPPSASVTANLERQEANHEARFSSRAWALRDLHEASYREFARAAGFGFMRMPSVREMLAFDKDLPPLELPRPMGISTVVNPGNDLAHVHDAAVDDFVSPQRMAYVRSRKEVAGFEPHRMYKFSMHGPPDQSPNWQVVRLELVSLLRQNEPRVYTSNTIPDMDQLADAPNRPLDEFEKGALPQLHSQEDVVFDVLPDRIVMLGAVRAGTTCFKCHVGERGKLLGAFSYELTPLVDAAATR